MGCARGLACLLASFVATAAAAQTFGTSGPNMAPGAGQPPAGFAPMFKPQSLPAQAPGPDVAFAAYQRGYYLTALREATRRLETNKSDAAAMTLIGELYRDGQGVRRDPAEAARWYRLAAGLGDKQAMFALAVGLIEGTGVKQDRAEARKWLEQAGRLGHAGALYNLGVMAIDGDIQDFRAAADFFRRAAEAGNVDGTYSLAVLYREGKGVPRDMGEAARWMKRAADERVASAEVEYGIMLFNGEGVAKNEAAAARYFLRAAWRNNPVAMNRAARLYAAGRGVDKNLVEAMKWHLLARAVGLNDEWLDGVLGGLNAREKAEVEEAVRAFVGR